MMPRTAAFAAWMAGVTFLVGSAGFAADPPAAAPAAPASTPAASAAIVTVTLVGGGKVTATLLRQSEEGVVLDLGYEVLQIPAKRVLDVRREDEADEPARAAERGIFRTGRLEAREVPELVKRFGEAVVMVRNPGGLGTGFLTSREGHLVTNYHVVENHTQLRATMFRRVAGAGQAGFEKVEFRKVKIVALQPLRDLALLQLDAAEADGRLPEPVVINDRDDLRVGDMVFAIGNPLGMERSVTQSGQQRWSDLQRPGRGGGGRLRRGRGVRRAGLRDPGLGADRFPRPSRHLPVRRVAAPKRRHLPATAVPAREAGRCDRSLTRSNTSRRASCRARCEDLRPEGRSLRWWSVGWRGSWRPPKPRSCGPRGSVSRPTRP
jgi:S1-C subfamily serine protease